MTDTSMICPRDGGVMISFQRAGVQIEQCESCKGIFLDRGELEQLTQAEQSYYEQPAVSTPSYQQPAYPPPGYYEQPRGASYYEQPRAARHYDEHHGAPYYDEHSGGHHSRRRSFLHEFFD